MLLLLGFGSSVSKSKSKSNKREAMQKASRLANRPAKRKSVKLARKSTQQKAADRQRRAARKAASALSKSRLLKSGRQKPVVNSPVHRVACPKPTLRNSNRGLLPKPTRTRSQRWEAEAFKAEINQRVQIHFGNKIPTIVESLESRDFKGKKSLPNTFKAAKTARWFENRERRRAENAAAALVQKGGKAKKKAACAAEVSEDKSIESTMDYLEETAAIIDLIKEFGYSLSEDGYNQGEVNFDTKVVSINGVDGRVKLAVLTHELVHILEHEGILSAENVEEIQNLLVPSDTHHYDMWLTQVIKFEWVEGIDPSEDLAYSLMTYPIALMQWLESKADPSFTSGDVVETQRVEDEISNNVVTEVSAVAVYATISEFNSMTVEEKARAMEALFSDERLSAADALWLQGSTIDSSVLENPWFNEANEMLTADFEDAIVTYGVLWTYLSKGLTPFPSWIADDYDKIVFINRIDSSNGDFLEALSASPILDKLASVKASTKWVDGKKVWTLSPSEDYIATEQDIAQGIHTIPPYEGEAGKVLFISSDSRLHDLEFEGQPVYSAEWLFAVSILKLLEQLSVEEIVDFICCFEAATKKSAAEVVIGKANRRASYHEIVFNFETGTIEGSREFQVRHKGYLRGHGAFNREVFMGLMALELVAYRSNISQSTVEGKLAYLTQLWEEADVYGQIMDNNQQLRVIRENTLAILRVPCKGEYRNVLEERDMAGNKKFPYFRLWNSNDKDGVAECTKWCTANSIPFMVDKNSMKRVVIGAGVSALWIHMDFEKDAVYSITDIASKENKLLNRPWNSVAISAEQGFEWQKGYAPYEDGALRIVHRDAEGEQEIIIRGDRKLTLTTDGSFLINGSGVGNSNTTFAYSVPVRIRGTFNAINLRKGEAIQDVAAQIEIELMQAFSQEKRLAATTKKRVLFTFRGIDILEFSGINQDIAVIPEMSNIRVRCLATSSSIEISANVYYYVSDSEVKGRGQGIKASLVDASASGFTISNSEGTPIEWDVHLNAECLKGNSARLTQWAEATGKVCRLDLSTQTVDVEGEIVDLNDESSAFYAWWRDNTKTYILEDTVDFYYFSYCLFSQNKDLGVGYSKGHCIWPIQDGLPVVDWNLLWDAFSRRATLSIDGVNSPETLKEVVEGSGYFLRVKEKVNGVLAPYIYQIELASVRECSSKKQSNTLQQLTSVYVGNPQLAYALMHGSREIEDSVMGVVASAMNTVDIKYCDLDPNLSKLGSGWEGWAREFRVTPEFISTLANPGTFGITGPKIYQMVSSDPFGKFVEEVGSKFAPKAIINKVGITDTLADQKFNFFDVMEGVAWNYQVNVGTGYNMGSVALAMCVIDRFAMEKATRMGDTQLAGKCRARLGASMRVAYMSWIVAYEDSWLAGYNAKGMKLAELLHQARKGATDLGGNEPRSRMENINLLVDALTDISGVEFTVYHVDQFLKCFQVARGISYLERYDRDGDGYTVAKTFNFSEDDMDLLAIAGAFRRCDQGSYSNYIDPREEGEEGNSGTSTWNLLNQRWLEVQEKLPFWLRRKMFKAMEANICVARTKKALSNVRDSFNGGSPEARERVTTIGSLYEATPIVRIGEVDESIPFIEAEDAFDDKGHPYFEYIMYSSAIEKIDGKFVRVANLDDRTVLNKPENVGHWNFCDKLFYPKARVHQASDILDRAARAFPNGVVIYCGKTKTSDGDDFGVYLDFAAIAKAGAIMTGGSATGLTLRLASLIIGISRKPENRPQTNFTMYCRNNIASIGGQLRSLISKGLMRRIARVSPNTQGAKVRTSHNCADTIIGNLSIPTIVMNPHDALVKCGNYTDGCFVSVGRTPQLAEIYGILRFDESVAIGFIKVSAVLWAMSNRGDGDGDGITIKNLSHLVNDKADKLIEAASRKANQ